MTTLMTGRQAKKILEIFKDAPSDQVQEILKSGVLADVRDGNYNGWTREKRHKIQVELGLKPLQIVVDGLKEFFKTRDGLWVSDEFRERILAPALEMPSSAPASVGKPFDLPKDMTDTEIRKELGENHVFENARAFCLYLKGALEHQWGGREGELLNTDYRATIFYVRGINSEVFAGSVYWSTVHREWFVNAFRLDDFRWNARRRAFPCN